MLMALLGACVGPGVKQPPTASVVPSADAIERETARIARVRAQGDWSLSGRVAVSNAGRGGSGKIEWSQHDGRFDVALSAPVTRQSWRLSGSREGARLEGLEGGPREGADAGELLLQATGWDIPVSALAEWLRGLPAADLPTAKIAPGPDGRPLSIEQGGWNIAYQWPASSDLPARLDARRGEARVRLIVDEWQAAATASVKPANNGWQIAPGSMLPKLRATGSLLADWSASPATETWRRLPDEEQRSSVDMLRAELALLNLDDPAGDAYANAASGDLRSIAVCGYSCEPVGLGSRDLGYQDARILRGTGDMVESAEHGALINRAYRYALAYNHALQAWGGSGAVKPVQAARWSSAADSAFWDFPVIER